MKIDLENIEHTLKKQKLDDKTIANILKDLTDIVEEEKEDNAANKLPKTKNEFLIVLSDPEGKIKDEFTGWVIQQRQDDDAALALEKIVDAAKSCNAGKKRKKNMITTMVEAFAHTKRKFLKEKNIMIKTKFPVRVLITNGKF